MASPKFVNRMASASHSKLFSRPGASDSACKPRWNVGEWGNCTEGNGTDCTQFQFRNVFCEQNLANNVPSLVDMEMCSDLGEPPLSVKSCDEEIEDDFLVEDESSPRYHTGPWTGCSKICGDGIRTREVNCYKRKLVSTNHWSKYMLLPTTALI